MNASLKLTSKKLQCFLIESHSNNSLQNDLTYPHNPPMCVYFITKVNALKLLKTSFKLTSLLKINTRTETIIIVNC
jgi:hypothetical protein